MKKLLGVLVVVSVLLLGTAALALDGPWPVPGSGGQTMLSVNFQK